MLSDCGQLCFSISFQAEEKNLSEVQIGFVFASFSMAGIFGSIFSGTLVSRYIMCLDLQIFNLNININFFNSKDYVPITSLLSQLSFVTLQLVQVGAKFIILSGMFWCAGATVCFGYAIIVFNL